MSDGAGSDEEGQAPSTADALEKVVRDVFPLLSRPELFGRAADLFRPPGEGWDARKPTDDEVKTAVRHVEQRAAEDEQDEAERADDQEWRKRL